LGNRYGAGTGEIWLDDVDCGGDEGSLDQCGHSRYSNCRHSEDVSIACTHHAQSTTASHALGRFIILSCMKSKSKVKLGYIIPGAAK